MEDTVSTHKTKIEQAVVEAFLNEHLNVQISNLEYIAGGEGAQAFSFSTEEGSFVIRVSKHGREAFYKDQYAFEHFASRGIPIPRIIEIGHLDDMYFFAISEKVEGETLDKVPKEKVPQLFHQMFTILDSLHAADISDTQGYGKWNKDSIAQYESWEAFILDVDKYAKGGEGKPSFFETTFLEKDLWDETYNKVKELLKYCPGERYLIHGDYGFNNMLSDGKRITGVIDWAESMYGDFLYDIAWLSFWSHDIDYEELAREHYQSIGKDVPNLKERILCYKLQISLGASSFYAYSNQEEKYKYIKERVKTLLNQ
ncbi:MAG: hypothetical protein RLY57_491 [Candidatus Parcubacteria bacterium]|jgi:hygromycin-B 4-O-kinase